MTEKTISEEWIDLRFVYDWSQENLEIVLLDYIDPFLNRIKGGYSEFHFLHYIGLDLRLFGAKEAILEEAYNVFGNFRKTHPLLKDIPRENPPERFTRPMKKPDIYLTMTAKFLQCTSEIIMNLLKAKRSDEVDSEKIFGFDIHNSRTLFPDFTHLFLNQLGYGDHNQQGKWFHNLSELWRLSDRSFLLEEIANLRNQVAQLNVRSSDSTGYQPI